MKKILMAAVAVAALGATPAYAADFTVSGSVALACGGLGNGTIAFGALTTDANTGVLADSRSLASTGQSVYCNGANSTIAISKTDMTNGLAPSDTSFTNTVTYTAGVTIGGTTYAPGATIGLKAGSLVVTASGLSSNAKIPVAGSYSGMVTVTLTPAA